MHQGGYHGRALRVDLDTGQATELPLEDDVLRRFVGGVGLGTWLLLRESPAGVEPLAPQAACVIALSPLVGSPLTTSAKFAVVAKSPLTDRIGDALASDRFAMELKACGIDALVLRGQAPAWSLLVVDDGDVRLEAADDLRGLSAEQAEASVRRRLGRSYRFFGIGPAGEHGVRYATISGGGRHAGRGGLGAVFGAKRLKGVAVRGKQRTPLADGEATIAIARDLSSRSMGAGTAKYRELGTVANVLVFNRLGTLPTRNFQAGTFEGADALSAESLHAMKGTVRKHCAACTIGCEHVFPTKKGKGVRLEYEGLFALGPLCGIDDRDVVLEAASRCDDLGLDVISAGGTIAFAMECHEKGLLPDAPAFGDADGLLTMLDAIARRDGLGELLAEGSRRAAATIGDGAERFACHVKGLELPGYEPRALKSMALGLAVGTRGADHNRSGAYEEDFRAGANRFLASADKAVAVVEHENRAALMDSLILCKFLRGVFDDLAEESAVMLRAVTGWDVTADELRTTGARIVVARRLFNEREGWTRAEDTLPPRFLEEALDAEGAAGGATLAKADLEAMVDAYYAARGLDAGGCVRGDQLSALGLADVAPGGPS